MLLYNVKNIIILIHFLKLWVTHWCYYVLIFSAGFSLTPVMRLKNTWRLLPSKYAVILDSLRRLTSSDHNHKNYVEALKVAPLPTLPYLGVYLTWITFTDGLCCLKQRVSVFRRK